MPLISNIVIIIAGLLLFSLGLLFALPSFSRRETRAGLFGLVCALLGLGLLGAGLVSFPGNLLIAWLLAGLILAGVVVFALPTGKVKHTHQRPSAQVDERTIMFSRWRLQPGTPNYESYYTQHPEHQAVDDAIRALPGLMSPNAPLANPLAFAAAEAAFMIPQALRDAVDGPVANQVKEIPPDVASTTLKHLGRYFGARTCGIAEVKPYQVYSHIGRGAGTYGQPIRLEHPYVIVFTFEMAEEMMRAAPRAEELMETARQYSEAAQTAVQVAAWIRALGYEARAHIDGNYRLILPLAARDAGLGEIGRMGLLMTPGLGPRVRLSAVTTAMPLAADQPGDNPAVLDFCRICKKCAENCPSKAIPAGDRQEIDGALRWKINSELCFHYWNAVGTDCGRCMQVCPYSHATDPAHNLVRWLVARSGAARRLALLLDDWVYSRKPKTRPSPAWTRWKS